MVTETLKVGRATVKPRDAGSGLDKFDVAFFTASCDPVEKNTRFAKELKLDYPILSDPDGKAAKAFGVFNEDRGFSNRWTYIIGKNGKVLAIDKKVKAGSHGKDIAKKLAELKVAKKK